MSLKFVLSIISLGACILSAHSAVDPECAELPDFKCKDACCKLPEDFFDKATVEKCMDEVKPASGDKFLGVFKMNQCMLKVSDMLNGEDADQAKVIAYIEKNGVDASFKPVMKQAVTDCFASVAAKFDEITKIAGAQPFNIKPDQCNIKNLAISFCSTVLTFSNCPKQMSKDDQKCNDQRAFVKKCFNNLDNVQSWFIKMAA